MWISKREYEDWQGRLQEHREMTLEANARAVTHSEQNKVLQVNLDWFRLRVTQLEKERAQLTLAVLGVKIPVPEFTPISPAGFDIAKTLSEAGGFEDVGDEVAQLMGMGHNPDGTVFHRPAPTGLNE